MATSRSATRAHHEARASILNELIEDHKRVKKAYRAFLKLDTEADPQACDQLVKQVLAELQVHSTLEEELVYPVAREVKGADAMVDEAEVEHASMKSLIEQLKTMSPQDEKFAARFTVLCEYVLHHVKEEEGEMFPALEKARAEWADIAAQMTQRRQALMTAAGMDAGDADQAAVLETDGGAAPGRRRASAAKAGA